MANTIANYFITAKEEFKKVTWPSRDETVKKTVLVVIISLAVATYLGLLDYIFNKLLEIVI